MTDVSYLKECLLNNSNLFKHSRRDQFYTLCLMLIAWPFLLLVIFLLQKADSLFDTFFVQSMCLPHSHLSVPQDFLNTALSVSLGNETECREEGEWQANEVWQQQQQWQESSPAEPHSAVVSAKAVSSHSEHLQVLNLQKISLELPGMFGV